MAETLTKVRERYLKVFTAETAGLGEVQIIDGTPDAHTVAFEVIGRVMAVVDRRRSARPAGAR